MKMSGSPMRLTAARVLVPLALIGVVAACSSAGHSANGSASAAGARGRVLLVGTLHGHAGRYTTIQAAVDASHPGDWILVGPGDYHETADATTSAEPTPPTAISAAS